MTYLRLNGVELSSYVNALKVGKQQYYKSMLTAAGNTLVKPINTKYIIEVGFRSLTSAEMKKVQQLINKLSVTVTFLEPTDNKLKTINCMLTTSLVEYYTIQDDEISYKPFTLQFTQL